MSETMADSQTAAGGQAETLERIVPWALDRADPTQAAVLEFHLERYRFACRYAAGKRVLDLACGVGYGSAMLAEEGGAASVLGVDVDPSAVALAQEHYAGERVRFLCSAYQAMPRAERFEVMVSLETIEHLPDPADFLAFAHEIVGEGGLLVGSVPITPSVDFNPHHLHDFTRRSIVRLLGRAGFRVVAEQVQAQSVPWRLAVRQLFASKPAVGQRQLRRGLVAFYLRHPGRAWARLLSTLRHGLDVRYLVFAARGGGR